MDQIGVKTEILRLKQVEWQNCKYQKAYFFFFRNELRFQQIKTNSGIYALDRGF
jgi:hypothetical protein